MPIESRFLENMANALNAEIVGKLKKLRKSQVALPMLIGTSNYT